MGLREDILALPQALRDQEDTKAITDALNATVPTRLGVLSRGDFAEWAANTGMRAKIEDHATDKASPLRSIALACRDVIAGATDGIDFSRENNRAMLGVWVSAQEITQSQADELMGKAIIASPYDEFDVRCICWSDDGVWQV